MASMVSANSVIFYGDIQFVVADPAGQIEVAGADAGPAAIGHGGLGVNHGAIPLKYAYAGL
jgi:hypothetical protein